MQFSIPFLFYNKKHPQPFDHGCNNLCHKTRLCSYLFFRILRRSYIKYRTWFEYNQSLYRPIGMDWLDPCTCLLKELSRGEINDDPFDLITNHILSTDKRNVRIVLHIVPRLFHKIIYQSYRIIYHFDRRDRHDIDITILRRG